jgi:hypothetical protein
MRYLKKVFISIGVVLLLHVIACWVLALLDKQQPDTLTISLFGFAGMEAGIGGWIKYLDTKEERND